MQAKKFLVGTASWTDPSLIDSGAFYPPEIKTPEQRLRFYASHFDTVEVDSTYYTLLSEHVAALWVSRTPPEFVFNVKAFGMLTHHRVEISRLPRALRAMLPDERKATDSVSEVPQEVRELAFQMFYNSLRPLISANKLGVVVFQFPPYFVRRKSNYDYIAGLRAYLPGINLGIEFRHRSWLVPDSSRAETLKFLREHGLYYISVDEPQSGSTVPPIFEATGTIAYVRFHGRNLTNWFKRNITTAERYMYLYSETELREWADRVKRHEGISRAFLIFNNCYRNFAVINATMMTQILRDRHS